MNAKLIQRFYSTHILLPVIFLLLLAMLACLGSAQLQTAEPVPATQETMPVQPTAIEIPTEESPTETAVQPATPTEIPLPETALPSALQPGDIEGSLTYGGIERSYILHIPTGYDPSISYPVVLAFHGFDLDAQEMIRISGLNVQADESGFIAVYPEGSGEKKSWNGGQCCGSAAKTKVDDVGFVREVIEETASKASIDRQRIFATGFSNGAIFVYRLACELSSSIAAIAPVSATPSQPDIDNCKPEHPVALIHFHGTADRLNPYDGLTTQAGVAFLSVDDTIQYWVGLTGCPTDAERSTTGSITHDIYQPCSNNTAVELYTIKGGEHAWPGGEAVTAQIGEPTMEITANELMWEFFQAHPCLKH